MNSEFVVFVTTANREEASRIAEIVVTERSAACVNIVPAVESIYWWEGKVTKENEVLLIIKTTEAAYSRLEHRIRELHSYATPEVIALRIEAGSDAYLEWLRQSAANME